jgi:hypothetical protein
VQKKPIIFLIFAAGIAAASPGFFTGDTAKSPVPRCFCAEEAALKLGMKYAIFKASSYLYGVDLVLTASLIEL